MITRSLVRVFVCLSFLILTLLASGQAAGAGPPAADTGGGGASAADTLDGPTLVGSGPERETVASGNPSWALTTNARSIQRIESTLAPGGELAGWDDIEAAAAEADEIAARRGQPY
jgi:hypothetical protein